MMHQDGDMNVKLKIELLEGRRSYDYYVDTADFDEDFCYRRHVDGSVMFHVPPGSVRMLFHDLNRPPNVVTMHFQFVWNYQLRSVGVTVSQKNNNRPEPSWSFNMSFNASKDIDVGSPDPLRLRFVTSE